MAQRTLLLLFSHTLTDAQKTECTERFGIDQFLTPPVSLQERWSNVDPDLSSLTGYAAQFCDWIDGHAESGDMVLVQGDFGLTWLVVNHCRERGLDAVYATTTRRVREREEDGRVTLEHVFQHVMFRRYGE